MMLLTSFVMVSLTRTSTILTLSIFATLFYIHTGNAEINPVQIAGNSANSLLCFSNKVYKGCNSEHRLDESGHLEVPCEATNEFCNGPCFSETKAVLKCINNLASNFLFSNGATTRFVRNALDNGCSGYLSQRGLFVQGDYNVQREGESCGLNFSGSSPEIKIQSVFVTLMLSGLSLLLFQHII